MKLVTVAMRSFSGISSTAPAHAAVIAAHAIWASWNVLSTRLMRSGSDPVVFAAYREAACALTLGATVCVRSLKAHTMPGQRVLRLTRREAALLVACGISLAAFQLSFLFGAARVDATTAGLSILLVPLLTLLATAAMGLEPLPLCNAPHHVLRTSYLKLAGVASACTGCAMLVLRPPSSTTQVEASEWLLGCAFLLLAAFGTVVFTLTQKPLLRRFGEVTVLASACDQSAFKPLWLG